MKLSDEIIKKLMSWCASTAADIILPNFYVQGYEMDLFKLKNSGYVYEYEIKISRADFKNDFKKNNKYKSVTNTKHNDISTGKRCNRFFFVVPENLITIEEVPEYAGLIYYTGSWFQLVKNDPMLHKDKFENFKQLAISLSYRETNVRYKLYEAKRRIKELSTK